MLIDGKIKNVRTKSKALNEGNVLHVTTVTVEFEDLDRSVLDNLAFAEHFKRFLTMEVHSVMEPPTIG